MAAPNSYKRDLMKAEHDHLNDTIKVALGGDNTAYTFDPDAHEFVSDVFDNGTTGEELSDSSYSRQVASNPSVTEDTTDDEGVFDVDDVTFSSLDTAQDIQFIVFYQQIGGDDTTPGDDRIIAIYDDDSAGSLSDLPLATNGSDVVLQIDSEGLVIIG
jgi:hypothetical protein